jgi:hypothetical protein
LDNQQDNGEYDVEVRFRPIGKSAKICLFIGAKKLEHQVSGSATKYVFKNVPFSKKGPVRLDCQIHTGDTFQGPWQVDVIQ